MTNLLHIDQQRPLVYLLGSLWSGWPSALGNKCRWGGGKGRIQGDPGGDSTPVSVDGGMLPWR